MNRICHLLVAIGIRKMTPGWYPLLGCQFRGLDGTPVAKWTPLCPRSFGEPRLDDAGRQRTQVCSFYLSISIICIAKVTISVCYLSRWWKFFLWDSRRLENALETLRFYQGIVFILGFVFSLPRVINVTLVTTTTNTGKTIEKKTVFVPGRAEVLMCGYLSL